MGCGASSAKGRETYSTVQRQTAESFFPPPQSDSTNNPPRAKKTGASVEKTSSVAAPSLLSTNGGGTAAIANNQFDRGSPVIAVKSESGEAGNLPTASMEKKQAASSAAMEGVASSSPARKTGKEGSAVSGHDHSTQKKKKKSTYVPPSPITAPIGSGGDQDMVSKGMIPPQLDPSNPSASSTGNKKHSGSSRRSSGNSHSTASQTANAVSSSNAVPSSKNKSAKGTGSKSSDSAASKSSSKDASHKRNNSDGDDASLGSADILDLDAAAAGDRGQQSGGLRLGEDFSGTLVINDDDFLDQTVVSAITTEAPAPRLAQPPSAIASTRYPVAPNYRPEPSSESGMRFDELYRLKGVLGTGAFSTVREGFHRNNHDLSYAVKCINRKKLSEEDEAALLDEVAILKEMKHVHIIRLFDFFTEPSTYYLVMERMRGGELFDRIVAKAYYNEKEARDTCKIVLEAVRYCHENHVAHRDLKPENLLLLSDTDDSEVKIADFGFAKKVYTRNSLKTQCGTPGYVAPEILEGTPYDERADMWSVGVILYILLGGYPPFIESTQRDLFRKIRKGDYEFHEEYWGTVSQEAKELISSLLTVDPNVRLTADEALENSWILGDDATLARKDLGANLDKLRNFNAKRKFRAAVVSVMAVNKLQDLSSAFFHKKD